jgi:hypothetical protein
MTNRAHARRTDPSTSHAAAASVGSDLTDNQRAVMTVLRVMGRPVLDEELVREYLHRYKALHLPRQSESGLRSRRSELTAKAKLVEGEKKRMSTGRLGRTWSVRA